MNLFSTNKKHLLIFGNKLLLNKRKLNEKQNLLKGFMNEVFVNYEKNMVFKFLITVF